MKTRTLFVALGLLAAAVTLHAEDAKAPDTFKAQVDTTKGKFTIEVTRAWAPNGADRFYTLAKSGYFKDIAFFRVVPGFMCQFGIPADPAESALWKEATIVDDPVTQSNTRGMVSYATSGLHTLA